MKTATTTLASPKTKTVDVKMLQANDVEKDEVKTPAEPTAPKLTKKSVIIKLISTPDGSTINDMAQAICDLNIDPDLEKNKRVCRLWISKIGFKVEKKDGKYFRAI